MTARTLFLASRCSGNRLANRLWLKVSNETPPVIFPSHLRNSFSGSRILSPVFDTTGEHEFYSANRRIADVDVAIESDEYTRANSGAKRYSYAGTGQYASAICADVALIGT